MSIKNKIKVVILIDTWFPVMGGGQTHVYYLAKYLKKHCDVEILTSNQKGRTPKEFLTLVKIKKLGPLMSTNNPFRRIIFLIVCFLYLIKNDYDLIHAQAFISGFPAKLTSIIRRKPVIYTVHGTGLVNELIYQGPQGLWKKLLEKILLLKIKYDAQISVSRDFLKLQNVNKVTYIPNGKTSFISNKFERIPNSVLYVGRIHPQKGINILLKAFIDAQKTINDLKLTIIGTGKLGSLKNALHKLGLKKSVEIKRPIYGEELVRIIDKHSIFILPSLYEGQPITLIEALAVRTPIIASKVGDIPFLLKNNSSALLVKPNDWKGFSKAIVEILDNRQFAEKLAENGYEVYKSHDSWQDVAYETFKLYQQVLKNEN